MFTAVLWPFLFRKVYSRAKVVVLSDYSFLKYTWVVAILNMLAFKIRYMYM